jgi:xanthine dehydrogenase large subunit
MRKLGNIGTKKNIGQRRGKIGQSQKHDSADKHVCGSAVYTDDRPNTVGQLHAAIGKSTIAHGKILSLDLSEVERSAGVVAVITADDIPGHVDVGPVFPGDLLFASEIVEFNGQALFAVAASSHELACKAATLAKIEYQELPPILSVEQAHEAKSYVRPSHTQKRGDSSNTIADAAHR